MAAKLRVYPAYYRRVRYYRKWIAENEGRPQVAARFVSAVEALVLDVLKIRREVIRLVSGRLNLRTFFARTCRALLCSDYSIGGTAKP